MALNDAALLLTQRMWRHCDVTERRHFRPTWRAEAACLRTRRSDSQKFPSATCPFNARCVKCYTNGICESYQVVAWQSDWC